MEPWRRFSQALGGPRIAVKLAPNPSPNQCPFARFRGSRWDQGGGAGPSPPASQLCPVRRMRVNLWGWRVTAGVPRRLRVPPRGGVGTCFTRSAPPRRSTPVAPRARCRDSQRVVRSRHALDLRKQSTSVTCASEARQQQARGPSHPPGRWGCGPLTKHSGGAEERPQSAHSITA